jgi:hypothetical protein
MNENAQEDNSVDAIKDDTVNSNSQDSFNKDLQKKYEEHKKSETKVPHRPISSYTSNRNFNQANKEIDPVKQIKNKPQSAQATKSNNNSNNSNSKEQKKKNDNDIGIEDILKDLNNFLLSHKIKKSDFIDNPNVFLTFEDFIDVFKQIHYILPKKYLKVLFNYNNPEGAKENYVLMSNFIKNLNFYKIEGIGNDSDFSKIENSNLGTSQMNSKHSNQNNTDNKTLTEGLDKKSNKSIYELKYINEQYNQFNKDIIDILKNSKNDNRNNMFNQNYNYNYTFGLNKRPIRGKNLSASKISIESKPKMANYYNEENKSKEREREIIKNIIDSNKNENSKISEQKNKYDISQILKNMEKEEEKEANFIRYQFDKRDKQFLKDCVYKCEECNRICSLLGINRNYSVAFDEEMKCRIQEEGKEDFFISLKELVIDWRRLYKQYHQNEILEKYKEKEDVNKNKNVELILNERKKEKEEKHREIKEVLIEAVRLKTKLKSQLDDLKSNIKIDEKIVLEHLSRAGMDIPGYNNNNEKNITDTNKNEKL